MESGKKIIIGVLGCAGIAKRSVIPAIRSLGSLFELRYVASRSMEKAYRFSTLFGCNPVAGYEELVNMPEVDALYIPLPTRLHKEWINKALLAGKHVYAEKSIAWSCDEAVEMVNNAAASGVALMEGYMFLYHSQHRLVSGMLQEGRIGEIRHFSSSFGFPPLPPDNFRYSEELGAGALMDAAGYPLRAVHFIMGPGFEVRGATLFNDPVSGTNIYGSAFLSDSRGTGASISFGFDNFYRCSYGIWGSKGKITAKRAFTPSPDFSPSIILEDASGMTEIKAAPDNHFVHAFEEFGSIILGTGSREKHFHDILLQSRSLDLIRTCSKNE